MGLLPLLLKFGITGALIAALLSWVGLRPRVTGTTLLQPWVWGIASGCAWLAAWIATAFFEAPRPDQIWYLAAVLQLCPPLAVLGAKQPMSRAWTPFVIVPLLLVLGWSAVASLFQPALQTGVSGWDVDAPVLVGFLLVLVMAAGNHLTTRFVGPVMLWVGAMATILLSVAPSSEAWPLRVFSFLSLLGITPFETGLASLLLAVATWGVRLLADTPWSGQTPLDRTWREFRDLFGAAWARRIQDRMNDLAVQYNWDVRLDFDRFVASPPSQTLQAISAPTPEQSLRWLLRRFVNQAWLDQRLSPAAVQPEAHSEGSRAL